MTNRCIYESKDRTARVTSMIYLSVVVFGKFTKIVRSRLAVLTFCIFLTGNVIAQEAETVSATDSISSIKKFKQAINMCPGAIAFGMYSINYEYLFDQTHGLVGRFDYGSISESYSDDTIEADGFTFILNYRWHFCEAMESGYLGSFVRYKICDGTGTAGLTKFDFTITELTLGLNIGRRWVWNCGFNLNFSIGYGISTQNTKTDPTNPSIKSTINKFKDESMFLDPLFGELSIGYAF